MRNDFYKNYILLAPLKKCLNTAQRNQADRLGSPVNRQY